MFIRHAQQPDVMRIAEIHVRAWQRAYRGVVSDSYLDALSIAAHEAMWTKNLGDPGAYVLVAEESDRVIGWLAGGRSRDSDADAKTAEMYAIYVDPSYWRCGTGRMLWNRTEAHFTSLGRTRVTLWVFETTDPRGRFTRLSVFILIQTRGRQSNKEARFCLKSDTPQS